MSSRPRRGQGIVMFFGVMALTALAVSVTLAGFVVAAFLAGVWRPRRWRGLPFGIALAVLATLFLRNVYLLAVAPAWVPGPLWHLLLKEPWMFAAAYAALGLAAFFTAWCGIWLRRLVPPTFPAMALYRAMAQRLQGGPVAGDPDMEDFYASLSGDGSEADGQEQEAPPRPSAFDE